MSIKLITFLITVLLLLFGMHYAFFKSLITFFSISRPAVKILVYCLMIFLSLSFISAFLLLHWQATPWTIWYYRASAAWMGFLIHLLVAVSIVWVLIAAAGLSGLGIPRLVAASVVLVLCIVYSLYSVWGTFHPRVRELTVGFKHLPENWEGKKLVQLSDVHLGYIHGREFAERLVKRVNALGPDLILITGDLLDGVNGDYDAVIEPICRLRATYGIFFVTGNHEYYVGIKKALAILRKTPLRILDNELVDVDGLEIVGIGYPGINSIEDIANLPQPDTENHARILLFHTPTNMKKNSGGRAERHFSAYWKPDTSFELNKQVHCELQLSGHTHYGQIFPLNFATRYLFNGYDYGLNHSGDFTIYTTCGTGSWGPPLRSPLRPEIVLIRPVRQD